MTIDNEEVQPYTSAKGAAASALSIALRDMSKALAALERGEDVDECIAIFDECADQIALGRSILTGPTWSMTSAAIAA